MIEEAWRELPAGLRRRLDNVQIAPADEDREARQTNLFGLYEGVPEPDNLGRHHVRITLWQATMERHCGTPDELRAQVRETLFHEIGHHFGLSEEEVRRATYQGDWSGLEWLLSAEDEEAPPDPAQRLLVLVLFVPLLGLWRCWASARWEQDDVLVAAALALGATVLLLYAAGPFALLTLAVPGFSIPAGLAAAAWLWWRLRANPPGRP